MPFCKSCHKSIQRGQYCDKPECQPVSRSRTQQQAGVNGSYQGKKYQHHTSLNGQKTQGGGKGSSGRR